MSEAISTKPNIAPVFNHGEGVWLTSKDGQRYFDATSGSGAIGLGHQHPCVINACHHQIDKLIHTGCKLNSEVRQDLADKITSIVPIQNASVLFSVIGSEAVESAFKIARAYTGRKRIICFEHAYHGKSRDALGATWRATFKQFSSISSSDYIRVSSPYIPEESTSNGAQTLEQNLDHLIQSSLDEFEQMLKEFGDENNPELPAAFIIEPIQITEGVLIPPKAFIDGIIQLSRQYGVVSIIDEIYTAFGRCGSLFYCDTLANQPDLMLLGKSIANGLPISLVVGNSQIMNTLPAGVQTSTYSGSPLASAAALAVTDFIINNKIWDLANQNGRWLSSLFYDIQRQFNIHLKVRQIGMLLAFEFESPTLTSKFIDYALKNNLILFGGGYNNSNVKVVPPILLDPGEKEFLATALLNTFNDLYK